MFHSFQGIRTEADFPGPALRIHVQVEREETGLQRVQSAEADGGERGTKVESHEGQGRF